MSASRTRHTTRNIAFSIMAYMIQIVLGFLVRRYFLYFFNEQYLGLNTLFANVISLLSLAELGFGSALVFSMYKPMSEGDEETVKQLLGFYKKCYFIIGTVVLALGLCVLPFMNYFAAKAPDVKVSFYGIYLIFLFNSVISYFFAHRRSLLYASQRNDVESKVNIILNILTTALQLIAVCVLKNYYIFISLTGISAILSNVLIVIYTNKHFPQYVQKSKEKLDSVKKKEINKNVWSLICHKIGATLVTSTDSLIIFLMIDGSSLGLYSNYLLIASYIGVFTNMFLTAIRSSVGNSIASRDNKTNLELFYNLNFIHMWIISFCTIGMFVLANPFIETILSTGKTNLVFGYKMVLIISLNLFFAQSRYMLCVFKESAGLFYEDRIKPLFEGLVNLITSIILAYFIGIEGVVIGTIISNVCVCLWVEPRVTYKHYFKAAQKRYWLNYLYYFICMLAVGAITSFVCGLIPTGGIWLLIAKFALVAVFPNALFFLLFFKKKEFGYFKGLLKNIFGGVLGKLKRKTKVETLTVCGQDIDKDGIKDTPDIDIAVNNKSEDKHE